MDDWEISFCPRPTGFYEPQVPELQIVQRLIATNRSLNLTMAGMIGVALEISNVVGNRIGSAPN
ncbi:hypothetical protein SAMN02927900_05114 [Rhizobium mongolense subsp. loessense]|uniref:Uncharacterized protein n=1 Tax=Rhizobium mongolense subsp. loessense TaxID=158890 RepID=A0A1G4TH33_9HYPH|nr:hypothetical protein [Rhizobium mongolense]SCW80145.1 hypothetical protein SAMN02927900_05114 [Rhizobium mongolense subsp. loessense]